MEVCRLMENRFRPSFPFLMYISASVQKACVRRELALSKSKSRLYIWNDPLQSVHRESQVQIDRDEGLKCGYCCSKISPRIDYKLRKEILFYQSPEKYINNVVATSVDTGVVPCFILSPSGRWFFELWKSPFRDVSAASWNFLELFETLIILQ